jgi:hypothetical protein
MIAVFRTDDGELLAIGDARTRQGASPAVDSFVHVAPTG